MRTFTASLAFIFCASSAFAGVVGTDQIQTVPTDPAAVQAAPSTNENLFGSVLIVEDIVCTLEASPDGTVYDICGPRSAINPGGGECAPQRLADGRVVDVCNPVAGSAPSNQVPAPGGLALILIGLGYALRRSAKIT